MAVSKKAKALYNFVFDGFETWAALTSINSTMVQFSLGGVQTLLPVCWMRYSKNRKMVT